MKIFLKKITSTKVLLISIMLFQVSFSSGRIIGGRDADIEEVPWQVFLKTSGCGGVILSETWILTAAHCYDPIMNGDPEITEFEVVAGITLESDPDQKVIKAKRFVKNDGIPGADIALMELSEPITLGPKSQPISFATQANADAGLFDPGVMATVSGWGLTDIDVYEFPDHLKLVEVPIVSVETANASNAYNGQIKDIEIPAGYPEGGKDACTGDSGGPMVVPNADGTGYILAGIVSWGEGCGYANLYGIYARVSTHSEWIQEVTGLSPEVEVATHPILSTNLKNKMQIRDGNLLFRSPIQTITSATLYNITGSELHRWSQIPIGESKVALPTQLTPGSYIVKINSPEAQNNLPLSSILKYSGQ